MYYYVTHSLINWWNGEIGTSHGGKAERGGTQWQIGKDESF